MYFCFNRLFFSQLFRSSDCLNVRDFPRARAGCRGAGAGRRQLSGHLADSCSPDFLRFPAKLAPPGHAATPVPLVIYHLASGAYRPPRDIPCNQFIQIQLLITIWPYFHSRAKELQPRRFWWVPMVLSRIIQFFKNNLRLNKIGQIIGRIQCIEHKILLV